MVIEGRVRVNGKIIDSLGSKADPSKDHIKVDGKRLAGYEPQVTFLLNKPKGYLSTVKDPKDRPTVMDFFKKVPWRIYPVGRLDFDAEGLLLLTNDGDLTLLLSHPKFSIPRTYWVKVGGLPGEKDFLRLKKGIMLEDGRARVVSSTILRQTEKNSWVQVVVTEGRNRLVKRIFSAIGYPVLKLKRVQFGPIRLGDLKSGQFRHLTPDEVTKLKRIGSDFRGRSSEHHNPNVQKAPIHGLRTTNSELRTPTSLSEAGRRTRG